MSGCVHCIYDIYSTSLADYSSALACALDALRSSQTPRAAWPLAVKKFDEKGGEEGGAKELLQDMDPTMRAFLEMEGRLKKTAEVAQDGKKG
jgi:aarF domain-containing kinase